MILLGSFKINRIAALFLMQISPPAIYAMLRRGKTPFDSLFWGSLKHIFSLARIRNITIKIDDTDRVRCKSCRILPFVRKAMCKVTRGWIQAQSIVFIILVSDKITVPIWFYFHRPANLTDEQKKICRKNPARIKEFDPKYRTKVDLAAIGLYVVSRMLRRLGSELATPLRVRSVAGDNGFASPKIQQAVVKFFACQYISKANPSQKVKSRGKEHSLSKYFNRHRSQTGTVVIRGKHISLEYKAARFFVKAYGRKV